MKASERLLKTLRDRGQAHLVTGAEDIVRKAVKVSLNANQYDALVLFVCNNGKLGLGLKQAINAGDFELALSRMAENKYVRDSRTRKKIECADLITQRNEEIAIFSLRTA